MSGVVPTTQPATGPSIKFIFYETGRTKRERELVDADLRSHAAKTSHARQKLERLGEVSKQRRGVAGNRTIGGGGTAAKSLATERSYQNTAVMMPDTSWPWQMSRGYRHEPFNCVPGSDDAIAAVAINFLTQNLFRVGAAISTAYGMPNWWPKLFMAMSRGAEVFHAVVSVLAAVTAMVMRDAPDGFRSALSVGILHHRALAIKHLRERLSRPQAEADDGAIITIVFLKIFDDGMGDKATAIVHSRQLAQMFEIRGGLEQIADVYDLGMPRIFDNVQQFCCFGVDYVPIPDNGFRLISDPMVAKGGRQHEYAVINTAVNADKSRIVASSFEAMFASGLLCPTSLHVVARLVEKKTMVYNPLARQCGAEPTYQRKEYHQSTQVDGGCGPFVCSGHHCHPLDHGNRGLMCRLVSLAIMRHIVNSVSRLRGAVCDLSQAVVTLMQVLPRIQPPPQKTFGRSIIMWIWLVTVDCWSVSKTQQVSLRLPGRKLLVQMFEIFPEIAAWEAESFVRLGQEFFWYQDAPRWLEREIRVAKEKAWSGICA